MADKNTFNIQDAITSELKLSRYSTDEKTLITNFISKEELTVNKQYEILFEIKNKDRIIDLSRFIDRFRGDKADPYMPYPLPTPPVTIANQLQQTQLDLYIKLVAIAKNAPNYSVTYEMLKKRVQNKKLKISQRILREELLVAQEYFEDLNAQTKTRYSIAQTELNNVNTQEKPVSKWHTECRFEVFEGWFSLEIIKNLLELFQKQQEVSSSLIPIKGISKIMQAKLRSLAIYDVAGLLTKGKTQEKRNDLAVKLDVDVKLVNVWVKQADLWRIEGMTTDMAYLLVQIGIRNAEDLSKVDPDKAYPILERLILAQPDFYIIEKVRFEELIVNAREEANATHSCLDKVKFNNLLTAEIRKQTPLTDTLIKKLISQSQTSSTAISIETWEEAPEYLFGDGYIPLVLKTSGSIIRDGLAFLDNIPLVLPLPYAISGKVVSDPKDNTMKYQNGYPNLLVEISGISSSVTDKSEKEKMPSAYTDGNGNFRVILPEKLNLQEGITITVSNGGLYKQTFLKSASDIIDSVPEQKILNKYYELQAIAYEIAYKETRDTRLRMLESDQYLVDKEKISLNTEIEYLEGVIKLLNNEDYTKIAVFNGYTKKEIQDIKDTENLEKNKSKLRDKNIEMTNLIEEESRIKREIKSINDSIAEDEKEKDDDKKTLSELEQEYYNIKYNSVDGIITKSKPHSTDLEVVLRNLVSSDNKYEAKLYNEDTKDGTLIIIKDIFEGDRTGLAKALPSVKLMGNDENAVHLPTDMAPSRVFNYSMLQRLIEPELGPIVKVRRKLEKPVDVMDFKSKLYTNPDSYPQMSSLGIGYALNMHQAWVPNGFALGSLLYSLVLAPGEEQRLVVRESSQSYTVADDAMATDTDSQAYALSQMDDTTAAYNYAVNQLSKANSGYDYYAKTFSNSGQYGVSLFLASGGGSKSSSTSRGNGSSFANQSNAHNEASSAAQSFQHDIKSASDRISQSKRISVRTASAEESNSVATKIIANHNHSHAMTIQYWEVMRRFRLETCIDGVELVLFVPLKLIKFIPDGNYTPDLTSFNRNVFIKRYDVLLKYADLLQYDLPYKYRTGLNLIKKYAAMPRWEMEKLAVGTRQLTFTFNCDLLSFDDLSATLTLKNRKGNIAGTTVYTRETLSTSYTTTKALKQGIRDIRNGKINKRVSVTCNFSIPASINDDDLSHITLRYSCEGVEYQLKQGTLTSNEQKAYDKMQDKMWDLAKDNKGSAGDRNDIAHYKSQLPEAYVMPMVSLSSGTVMGLGAPTISNDKLTLAGKQLSIMMPNSNLVSSVVVSITSDMPVLKYAELQEIEGTMHHIAAETLRYSQAIWSSLSDDERAMMLEQYTIDMDFGAIENIDEEEEITRKNKIDIPLLNCVNVKKMLGFYGNCILLPFTYPQELAKKLGKTAAEVQDALYRYHTNCFRVPTTTVSLPTDGMIGEAVLGETNVSELIDLTRFWNWQDSPIDKMEITPEYLNDTDYLADKTTKDITALNLQGATAATPVTATDLIKALVDKKTPQFADITGLEQLKSVLNEGTKSAATGRDKVLEENTKFSSKVMDTAINAAVIAGQMAGLPVTYPPAAGDKDKAAGDTPAGGN